MLEKPFIKKNNIWCQDEIMRELTFHPNLTAMATRLAGTKLRIWHDHILAKMPELSAPTAFHQDLVKWPYDRKSMVLSAWISLQDTTVEMGCMSFCLVPISQWMCVIFTLRTKKVGRRKRQICNGGRAWPFLCKLETALFIMV